MPDTVEILIHTPPGSGPEAMAGALTEAATETGRDTSGWTTRSCTGGHGAEAMRALHDRPGDAGLLSTCTPSFIQTPLLEGLAITVRDLTPLACLMLEPYLVVVRASEPASTAAGFLSRVQQAPTATGGYLHGGINHLAGLAIAAATGAEVTFKLVESAQHLLPALLRGDLDWAIATPKEAARSLAAGEIRAVALLAPARSDRFEGLATLAEAGVPLSLSVWRGLMAPPGISEQARQQWHDLLRAVVRTRSWAQFLGPHLEPVLLTGADFAGFLEDQEAWYAEQFGRAGLLGSRDS